jgi:hypothetical protein
VLTVLRRGVGHGEVRLGAVVLVVAAVAPMLVMGFCLLRAEPVTDQTLTEIVDQVMLQLVQAPPEPGGPGAPELEIIISPRWRRPPGQAPGFKTKY